MSYLPPCPLFSVLAIQPIKKLFPPLGEPKSYQIDKPPNRKLRYVIAKDDVTTFATAESITYFHFFPRGKKSVGGGRRKKRKKTLIENMSIHGPHITSLSIQTGRSCVLKSRLLDFQWTLSKDDY